MKLRNHVASSAVVLTGAMLAGTASAQLHDVTQNPDIAGVPGHPADNAGIGRSYVDQQGTSPDDHGGVNLVGSSGYFISRDPARAIRRGRQLFQRKFQVGQGFGPLTDDGVGSTGANASRSAGLADSCASCHGRPRGAAGFGGVVATRPDSRDSPQLFGLGIVEMLGDEITKDLRALRDKAIQRAKHSHRPVRANLRSKKIDFGWLRAYPDGTVDTSHVEGVNPDLRVRPFFAQGATMSMREFIVGAANAEMGVESPDIDLIAAQSGPVVTPAGMLLDGTVDFVEGTPVANPADDSDSDGVVNEMPTAIVDFMEFYLLNYFKPGTGYESKEALLGRATFAAIGCAGCHVPNLTIKHDRRVADVETAYDAVQGNPFNSMFATATVLAVADPGVPATATDPAGVMPGGGTFVVRNFLADFKRHDLGPNFEERNYANFVAQVNPVADPPNDPTFNFTTVHITEPLWGVGDTAPYGHDGRSGNLDAVILRHGGEAAKARNRYAKLRGDLQGWVKEFLRARVLFAPDDTASNLRPKNEATAGYPQIDHGSINLGALFTTAGGE